MDRKKVTIAELQQKKDSGQKITMMTAYDYPTARLVDEAGIDTTLVGDSLAMVSPGRRVGARFWMHENGRDQRFSANSSFGILRGVEAPCALCSGLPSH